MVAYAAEAVTHARKLGVSLDYSEQSLEAVDTILSEFTKQGLLRPAPPEKNSAIWDLSNLYGSYVGQVVIAEFGGAWELQVQADKAVRIALRSQGIQMFPPEKIYKRLVQDESSGVSGYCRALRAIVQRRNETPSQPPGIGPTDSGSRSRVGFLAGARVLAARIGTMFGRRGKGAP